MVKESNNTQQFDKLHDSPIADSCERLSQIPEVSRAIDQAATILYQMEDVFEAHDDISGVGVMVNAEWLSNVCDALLEYAEIVDGVNVEELFEFADVAANQMTKTGGITEH